MKNSINIDYVQYLHIARRKSSKFIGFLTNSIARIFPFLSKHSSISDFIQFALIIIMIVSSRLSNFSNSLIISPAIFPLQTGIDISRVTISGLIPYLLSSAYFSMPSLPFVAVPRTSAFIF